MAPMAPVYSRTTDPDKALKGSPHHGHNHVDIISGGTAGHSDQYGPHQHQGTQQTTWFQPATQTKHIHMAWVVIWATDINLASSYIRIMVSGGSPGYSYQYDPQGIRA